MWFYRLVLVFLIVYDGFSDSYKYKESFDDDKIFSDCDNQPDGVLNVQGLFNFSEFTFDLEGDEIFLSGNVTSIWNIQPNDRIQVNSNNFHPPTSNQYKTIFCRLLLNYSASIVVHGNQLCIR